MRTIKNYPPVFIFLTLILSFFAFQNSNAQNKEKNKIRLNVQYVKIMDGELNFNMKATARVDRENIEVSQIELIITNEFNDDEVELGKITTNEKGEGKLVLKNINSIQADSSNTYNISVSFKGNDDFKRASKSISFKNADVIANVITKDSINYVSATLWDTSDSIKLPIEDRNLKVQIKRLFKNLKIGEEFNTTDENGSILVAIEDGIPGIEGVLTFEVILDDTDDYGTVKAIVQAEVGKPIVDLSTFNERTMWSPRNKTPLFLLIFPNILIFAIWGIIVYLIFNLIKITKK